MVRACKRSCFAALGSGQIDFRGLRFPGLISAAPVPSGVARIPFLAMPDAVEAFWRFVACPKAKLTRTVYNIGASAPSAAEVEAIVRGAFPDAKIKYDLDAKRQAIVDSGPADVDDGARRDWGHAPRFSLVLTSL